MFHSINWGYTLKLLLTGLFAAFVAVAPFVELYLWLTGVI